MASAKIKPVYVLCGSDAFLLDAYRRQIIESIVGDADPQLCVSTFDGDAELAEVLDELRTIPFLASRRVVIVRDADAFITAHRRSIEKFLESPVETSTLMLIVSSLPGNTRLAKLVSGIGQVVNCSAPEKGKLATWLRKAVGKRNKKIAPDAAGLLLEWMGNDLALLSSELEKLSLYVGDRETIGADDVAVLVTASAGPAAFALTNAIAAADRPGALKSLDLMLTVRGEQFRTLGMIAWHLRKALKARQLIAAGKPADTVVPYMPYQQKTAFAAMLKRRSLASFEADFRRLIAADLAMKSGADPTTALQTLVVGLCS